MMNSGEMEVELYPQGILAEKIRAAGAGLMGVVSDIGLGTIIEQDREVVSVQGRKGIFEPALGGDLALIHAARADTYGNLVFSGTARNFNPLMAMAAHRVVVEAMEIVPVGGLAPHEVHMPGAFVDAVVLAVKDKRYEVMEHHVG
jgi:acetate CoA/acetoacetate CoA-transferase alpha subunit